MYTEKCLTDVMLFMHFIWLNLFYWTSTIIYLLVYMVYNKRDKHYPIRSINKLILSQNCKMALERKCKEHFKRLTKKKMLN